MTDKQILDELLPSAPIFMAVSFAASFFLCLLVLPSNIQKFYVSTILSVIIPQLACLFPLYAYIFFMGDKYHTFSGKIFGSLIAISIFVSPHWIALLILSVVVFARHFRAEGKSYGVDAMAALVIGGALAALVIGGAFVE